MRIALVSLLIATMLITLPGCVPLVAGGVGAGVALANDRRTSGIYIEDQSIELKAQRRISDQLGDQVHIEVASYNLSVLLTGEAPTAALRSDVENIVKAIPNVRQVYNEIVPASPASFSSRSNDGFLTTKVKARIVEANKFNVLHVKVVSESSVVYLMGIVTHKEAEDATEVARTTSGVAKVVRLFEYRD